MAVWQNRPLDAVYPVLLIDAITRQGPRLVGRQPARLCGYRREPHRRTRRGGPVARTHRRRGCQAVGDDADRAPQPRFGRRVDRVLRRTARPARVDPHDLARRCGADLRRAHGAQQPPLRLAQALGPDHQSQAEIYTAPTVEAAEALFETFAQDSEGTYPAMIRAWRQSWDEFVPLVEFPAELRRIVYTTNAVENLNARFRRAVRHRGHSPQRASRHENPVPCSHHTNHNPSHSPLDKGASDRPHPAPDRCPSAYLADNWLQRGPDMPLRGF